MNRVNEQEKQNQIYVEIVNCIENGREERIKELVQENGNSYFDRFFMHGLPLLCAAVSYDHESLAKWLIEQGWNIEETDITGDTALIYAAKSWRKEMFLYLIEKGINIDHQCEAGATVLMDTMYRGEYELVEILYEKGSNMNIRDEEGQNFLDYLNETDNLKIEKLFNHFLETPERFEEPILKKIKAKRMEFLF